MKWQRKWTIRPRKKEKGALGSQTEVPQWFSGRFCGPDHTAKYTNI